ncbi:Cytochrome c [Anatilimnocola aggregata]|uniref:Cytochrome c n=2 Tax=Anatilimnocola aggregata TaxID=2528021 RepID=A0A517YDB7_9BACT|nr:Cytochrome c [Anatilimnocola aggregata]
MTSTQTILANKIESLSVFALGALAITLLAAGCGHLPGKPDPALRPIAPNEITDFNVLFERNCAGCHGRDGTLGPAPPLNDRLFLAIVPDAELHRIVSEGRHGTSMPAFVQHRGGPLTEQQVGILAAGLKPKWQGQQLPSNDLPTYAVSAGDPQNGEQVFAQACAVCHGEHGRGGDAGTINDVAFLSLISDQALRRLVITGRPDLGMPDHAGSEGRIAGFQPLSSEQINDVVALLASWRTANSVSPAQ